MSNKVTIPHDLIVEILSRVPVKSLIRFKCVSKSWWWIISQPDPELKKKHLKQSKSNMKVIIEGYPDPENLYKKFIYDVDLTILDKISISNMKEIKYHPQHITCSFCSGVLGCSNGVVCIYIQGKAFLLWNPSTRKQLVLPECCNSEEDTHWADGFCYDETTDDYKVFRLVKHFSGGFFRMHIFSLKSFKWRICMEDFAYESNISYAMDKGILYNGALHWILEDYFIIAFNLGTERFQLLPPPSDLTFDKPYLCEGILNGCYHMMLCDNVRENKWIMKDNSWSKLSLKNLSATGTQLFLMRPLGFDNNFMIYNLEKRLFENIPFPFSVADSFSHSYLYFENLYALHNHNEDQLVKGRKRLKIT